MFELPFVFSRLPDIHFGAGTLARLPGLLRARGDTTLLVTGGASFRQSPAFDTLMQGLHDAGVAVEQVSVAGEPSPDFVDTVSARFRAEAPASVVSIGGGSAIDAGKAISAMLTQEGSVRDFLEGQETRRHDGRKRPFIAVPTSSGTGAEATKNAVLSAVGPNGFKNSLRHDNFMPDVALVDPALTLGCPPAVTAACGLDALTQLLEAYVSTKASPLTDALAWSGLDAFAAGFLRACENGADDLDARSRMAYAALVSGIVLSQAGLGLVHGFAGPIGGRCTMPHGEVCGTLLGETTRRTLAALSADGERQRLALDKYARVGALLAGRPARSTGEDCQALIDTLDGWIERFKLPRLGDYGLTNADFDAILSRSNGKNSPATLNRNEMEAILQARR
ncbi:iron-containing alcohol dehydrogenase [Propionivibrio dicarboxylicus]|uniref:Alcohol dehydrogenase n=1 Tax=Propionivibrio dicarboxylicus TaxID=83767 RepID=A0A1G7V4I5_9RHOO|nr:iron-containing alcohol dehydrogenase [Propionivibrio dicarboxylicus]SDG54676.1 alcohol dehydrogenase [Propionivibrio dicarboxylicus]